MTCTFLQWNNWNVRVEEHCKSWNNFPFQPPLLKTTPLPSNMWCRLNVYFSPVYVKFFSIWGCQNGLHSWDSKFFLDQHEYFVQFSLVCQNCRFSERLYPFLSFANPNILDIRSSLMYVPPFFRFQRQAPLIWREYVKVKGVIRKFFIDFLKKTYVKTHFSSWWM